MRKYKILSKKILSNKMNLQQIIENYGRDGVVRVEKLFSPAQVEEIKTQLSRYMKEIAPTLPAGDRTLESDGKTVRNLWRGLRLQGGPSFRVALTW